MTALQIVTVPIASLVDHSEHDRIYGRSSPTDADIVALADAIEASGHYQPPVVTFDDENTVPRTVVSGSRVLLALSSRGHTEVQVIVRTFRSAAHLSRAVVLLNLQRMKTKWTMVMEVVVLVESLRPGARDRQRKAGGPRCKPDSAVGSTSVPEPVFDADEVDAVDLSDEVDVAATLSTVNAGIAGSDTGSEAESVTLDVDHTLPVVRSDTTDEAEAAPRPDGARTKSRSNRGGETLRQVARALNLGTDTPRLCLLVYGAATRESPKDPSASDVAAKLRAPGARLETIARDCGLLPAPGSAQAPNAALGDPLADPQVVAAALWRHALNLTPQAVVPMKATAPTPPLPPALASTIRGATDACVTLLATTSDPSLRLVHLCPREGVDLPPLHDEQMMVSEARLRDAIKNALMADWPVETIAVEAKLSGTVKHEEVAAWCQGQSVGLGHDDLCRLARWVERNHGRPNPSKAVRS